MQECLIFVFNGEFVLKQLGQLLLDDTLLLHHVVADFIDLSCHLSIMLFAEAKLSLKLESVGRAGLDPLDMLTLSVEFCFQRLHLRVVTLNLGLEHVLLKRALSYLLLQLAILSDEQFFLTVNLINHLAVFSGHFFNLFVHLFNLSLFGHKRHLGLFFISVPVVIELSDLELEGLELFRLHRNSNLSLITFLLFGLERQSMDRELLANGTILL